MTKVPHPSVFIREEMRARRWSRDVLAAMMVAKTPLVINAMSRLKDEPEAKRVRDWQVTRLALDMYFAVGPTEPNARLGEMAEQFAAAFGVSADLFRNLESAWLRSQGAVTDDVYAVDPAAEARQEGATRDKSSSDHTSLAPRPEQEEEAPAWMPSGTELLRHAELFNVLVAMVRGLDPAAADDQPYGEWDAAKWAVFNAAVRLVKETRLEGAAAPRPGAEQADEQGR